MVPGYRGRRGKLRRELGVSQAQVLWVKTDPQEGGRAALCAGYFVT